MFADHAYNSGFKTGAEHGLAGRAKRAWPKVWKIMVLGETYTNEYSRGYHAGYATGCRNREYQMQREASFTARRPAKEKTLQDYYDRLKELDRAQAAIMEIRRESGLSR